MLKKIYSYKLGTLLKLCCTTGNAATMGGEAGISQWAGLTHGHGTRFSWDPGILWLFLRGWKFGGFFKKRKKLS